MLMAVLFAVGVACVGFVIHHLLTGGGEEASEDPHELAQKDLEYHVILLALYFLQTEHDVYRRPQEIYELGGCALASLLSYERLVYVLELMEKERLVASGRPNGLHTDDTDDEDAPKGFKLEVKGQHRIMFGVSRRRSTHGPPPMGGQGA